MINIDKNNQKAFNDDATPYDFASEPAANETTDVSSDPFADFGSSIEISDDELPFTK